MSEVQRALEAHARSNPADAIQIRVGLHTGEVILGDDGDLFGKHVVLAARIANEAKGGEILVSSLVREIVDARGDLRVRRAASRRAQGPERLTHGAPRLVGRRNTTRLMIRGTYGALQSSISQRGAGRLDYSST